MNNCFSIYQTSEIADPKIIVLSEEKRFTDKILFKGEYIVRATTTEKSAGKVT